MAIYLNSQEAAEYLRYSIHWLQFRRCHGGGPKYIKCGRTVRYRKADLDAWIEGHGRRSHTNQDAPEPIPRKRSRPRVRL